MDDYYSYTLEKEDSGWSYTFHSNINQKIYSVNFDTYLYQEFLEQFPFLLSKGCALGFYSIDTGVPANLKDMLRLRIIQI